LKGKTVAVSRAGATDDYGARVAFKKWRLEPDRDVTMISARGSRPGSRAIKSGLVAGSLLQPPFTVRARQEGLVEFASLGDLRIDYLGTSLATTRQTIQKKENIVRRFIRAMIEGTHYYKTQKEASLQSIANFTQIKDRGALEEAYNTYAIKFMARVPYPSLEGVETILEDLAKTNAKARGADPKRFVESRFLKELEDNGTVAQLYR
jgi:ABC-type nitrate/sulfonate/bicarbonate transport system substrate-binding protein